MSDVHRGTPQALIEAMRCSTWNIAIWHCANSMSRFYVNEDLILSD